MALTAYEGGRSLPSVFSDIPSRYAIADLEKKNQEKEEQLQKARRRFGALAMWFFVLCGIVAVIAVVAFLLWSRLGQANADKVVLEQDNTRLTAEAAQFQDLARVRQTIQEERTELLELLNRSGLTDRQRDRGWQAARATCYVVANVRRCFFVNENDSPEARAQSQTWPRLLEDTREVLNGELAMVTAAQAAARTAQLNSAPLPPPPVCDQVTGRC